MVTVTKARPPCLVFSPHPCPRDKKCTSYCIDDTIAFSAFAVLCQLGFLSYQLLNVVIFYIVFNWIFLKMTGFSPTVDGEG